MFPADVLDDILGGVDDQADTRERLVEGYGKKTYGIDWENRRLFKAGVKETPSQKVVKYIMTPRGEVELYPDYADDLSFDVGYGSLVWTLVGAQIASEEEAKDFLQVICDDAASQQPEDIESVLVDSVDFKGDELYARIIITEQNGEVNDYAVRLTT